MANIQRAMSALSLKLNLSADIFI